MAEPITVNTTDFHRQWKKLLEQEVPENVVAVTNETAKEFRKELKAAAPRGAPANLERQAKRMRFARRGDWGPLATSIRRRGTKTMEKQARVWFQAFYIRFVILGSPTNRANPFIDRVLARSEAITKRAIAKTKMKRVK